MSKQIHCGKDMPISKTSFLRFLYFQKIQSDLFDKVLYKIHN